jgi:hypothetical protein
VRKVEDILAKFEFLHSLRTWMMGTFSLFLMAEDTSAESGAAPENKSLSLENLYLSTIGCLANATAIGGTIWANPTSCFINMSKKLTKSACHEEKKTKGVQ